MLSIIEMKEYLDVPYVYVTGAFGTVGFAQVQGLTFPFLIGHKDSDTGYTVTNDTLSTNVLFTTNTLQKAIEQYIELSLIDAIREKKVTFQRTTINTTSVCIGYSFTPPGAVGVVEKSDASFTAKRINDMWYLTPTGKDKTYSDSNLHDTIRLWLEDR